MRIRDLATRRSREGSELSRERRVDPFTSLQREMHRLFDNFFEGSATMPSERPWGEPSIPKVDVAETTDALQVTAELPGMQEKDVNVTLTGRNLVISGEKKEEKEDKDKNYHRVERTYGAFHRSIPLPTDVDGQKVDASFRNGVLNVILPKAHPSDTAGKKIAVRSAH
jgi:HSP20 family protein